MSRPKKKKKKRKSLLEALPSGERYECSYMHRDVVTHVATTTTDFVVTGSRDGHVKLWKKMRFGIEFVKHYHAHAGEVHCLCVSVDGLWLCTTGSDAAKLYDVRGFDMVRILRTKREHGFVPGAAAWVSKRGAQRAIVALAEFETAGPFRLFASPEFHKFATVHTHDSPVVAVAYLEAFDAVVCADARGVLEYWAPPTERQDDAADKTPPPELPAAVRFRHKVDTDLYALARLKAEPLSIAASGERFAVCASDSKVRLFDFRSGKLLRTLDESLETTKDESSEDEGPAPLDKKDDTRLAVERELDLKHRGLVANCVFDDSGRYLLYGAMAGVKVVDTDTGDVVRVLGSADDERFCAVALFQGEATVDAQMEQAAPRFSTTAPATTESSCVMAPAADPTVFATAFKRRRFYLLTQRVPLELATRDVLNEKPDAAPATRLHETPVSLANQAILRTTLGDVTLTLFPEDCPLTVENFTTHARNGYYDNHVFHRVIKSFMVQTGDPNGDGTGGESIWGHDFQDEFRPHLKHDKPFTLSMANAGPATNGSQFFITTTPCPWLDGKHTIFGRVTKGMDTVSAIEQVPCDRFDKPKRDVAILSIDLT